LNAPGIEDIMDLNIVPFGNAAFDTPDSLCGVFNASAYHWSAPWVDYDPDKRQCFETKCGLGVKDRLDSCFSSGKVYCQHGAVECAVNAMGACAKNVTNADWTQYAHVVSCLEDYYDKISEEGTSALINVSTKSCTKGWPSSMTDELVACYLAQAVEQQAAMAKETPLHPGVPFVRMKNKTGEWLELEVGGAADPVFLELVCAGWKQNGGGDSQACAKFSDAQTATSEGLVFA
jgi:hypothetical protein